mmetsp:Transcript_72802/g.162996  ORF Transcript_72802/g.162996 Transcript_72802/m.162996 type:complete len:232 (+) Transcript_72802:492-1187(+)
MRARAMEEVNLVDALLNGLLVFAWKAAARQDLSTIDGRCCALVRPLAPNGKAARRVLLPQLWILDSLHLHHLQALRNRTLAITSSDLLEGRVQQLLDGVLFGLRHVHQLPNTSRQAFCLPVRGHPGLVRRQVHQLSGCADPGRRYSPRPFLSIFQACCGSCWWYHCCHWHRHRAHSRGRRRCRWLWFHVSLFTGTASPEVESRPEVEGRCRAREERDQGTDHNHGDDPSVA